MVGWGGTLSPSIGQPPRLLIPIMREKYCYEPSEQELVNFELYLSDLEECKTIWFIDKGVILI